LPSVGILWLRNGRRQFRRSLPTSSKDDLTKYLSRRVSTGFALPLKPAVKQLARLQHLDLLLNDWGIHHLHISTAVAADGFVNRNDPLLFAMFEPEMAYLLDIGTHSSFVDQRLAEIAVENWPDTKLFLEIQGISLRNGVPYSKGVGSKCARPASSASFRLVTKSSRLAEGFRRRERARVRSRSSKRHTP
jgi:hypothetical protein